MPIFTFRVEGMHCGSCSLLVDDTLEDLPGVLSSQTSVKKQQSTVDLDLTHTSPEQVVTAIAELGYTASLV
ncbi:MULTISPECIES: heavy-metal-associated domain-containing protein [Nocardia]|uniref:Heavy-metal-associated domain-containing protein n=2 Tax=Nocardia TaxID=1817 RepID=A0A846XK13_9NOCA|nr:MULTISPECIES: heavy metal-associated domain-containing protein [Nocardia]MBF6456097.1 heavy-metal-associated domain-containing protein [Nocardia cyriacigeorgica]MBF6477247.1 heavy-metal-associated domain-containing protein [Nocardia cyriacigeorgica]MBF6553163.1 heavy-metal-associated domain-containing protein [Nocardia cyriacigeorgica]NKY34923.1 heavy-metal-associated domain-containing protein [Nocardia speluncae]TLF77730.1 heavy-metal-associated domain-containing protein [Nocardia cyriacig